MTDQDAAERRLLDSTRRVLSPSAEDAERVLAALSRTIALTAAGASVIAPSNAGAPLPGTRWRGLLQRLLIAATLAGGSGVLGYGAGFRAGSRSAVASASVPAAPPPIASGAPLASKEQSPKSPAPDETLKRGRTPTGSAIAHAPSAAPGASRKADENSLAEEVRTLRRVERALRDQNARLALALLGDLDKTVPAGQLTEERLAALVQARCALRYGSPSALLEEFSSAHPRSPYLTRVLQACGPQSSETAATKP